MHYIPIVNMGLVSSSCANNKGTCAIVTIVVLAGVAGLVYYIGNSTGSFTSSGKISDSSKSVSKSSGSGNNSGANIAFEHLSSGMAEPSQNAFIA